MRGRSTGAKRKGEMMANPARDRWLDLGMEVLSEEGVAGIRIDRLAARLGLSKGSFHHHFAGAEGFREELLLHIEDNMLGWLRDAVADAPTGESPRETLARLSLAATSPQERVYRQRLEVALRAWAITDATAARTQQRIDEARVEILRAVWLRTGIPEDDARIAALLPYVITIGATMIMPALDAADLRRLYDGILPLVPDAAAGDGDPA